MGTYMNFNFAIALAATTLAAATLAAALAAALPPTKNHHCVKTYILGQASKGGFFDVRRLLWYKLPSISRGLGAYSAVRERFSSAAERRGRNAECGPRLRPYRTQV